MLGDHVDALEHFMAHGAAQRNEAIKKARAQRNTKRLDTLAIHCGRRGTSGAADVG